LLRSLPERSRLVALKWHKKTFNRRTARLAWPAVAHRPKVSQKPEAWAGGTGGDKRLVLTIPPPDVAARLLLPFGCPKS